MDSFSENLGIELVDILYSNTNLNYDVCASNIIQIVEHLCKRLPQINNVTPEIVENIKNSIENEEINFDLIKLNKNLKDLYEINIDLSKGEKNFYECNSLICKRLEQSNRLLKNSSSRKVFKTTIQANRIPIMKLFEIWQLSTDKQIKNEIIELLNLCCLSDPSLTSHFYEDINLTSELCCHLKQDIIKSDYNSLTINLRFLTLLLSNTDSHLTKSFQDFLSNSDFLHVLFDTIESENEFLFLNLNEFEIYKIETKGQKTSKTFTSMDLLIHFILALNQKFVLPEENSIIKVINSSQESRKFLSEVIVNQINLEIDPLLDYKIVNKGLQLNVNEEIFYYVNPALKLVSDLFSCQLKSTSIFYTNDFNVLIDIMIRKLRNLSQNDQERVDYLSLLQLIAKNSNYKDSYYRRNDLIEIFDSILKEPNETIDQDIVRIILFENNNFK